MGFFFSFFGLDQNDVVLNGGWVKRHRLSRCQNDAVLISAWSKRRRFDPGRKKKIKTALFQSQPGRNGVVLGLLLQFINRPVSGSGRSGLQKKKKNSAEERKGGEEEGVTILPGGSRIHTWDGSKLLHWRR